MERRVIVHDRQQVTHTDLNNVGEFGRASLDNVTHDGIEPGRKFTGFQVVESAPVEVTVGAGRFFNQGKVFYRADDGGVQIQLADYLPLVTKRIVTIAVWGNQVDTNVQPRTFLTDLETGQTEADAVATESRRHAEVNAVPGTENANPQPPSLDANVLAVAHVTLTPAGIESIEMVEANRLASVSKNNTRLNEIDAWRDVIGTRVDTLGTELSGLAARLRGTVRQEELFETNADMARVKERLDMTDDLSSYGADHFLSLDQSNSDSAHPDWLARVEEGIRFPAAQQQIANLNLLNPLEDRVKLHGQFALPAYTPKTRISVRGSDGEVPIAQFDHQSLETTQKTMTRQRIRYGSSFLQCTNSAWWKSGRFDPVSGIFVRDGESYQVIETDIVKEGFTRPKWVRMRRIFLDEIEEPYWETITVTETVAGAYIGQTFLNSQDGWMTHVDLWFTQVAAAGDVKLMICETLNGQPNIDAVIAKVTVDQADLKPFPDFTRITVGPVYLVKGRRYAVVVSTPGNHVLSHVSGNKFAQGMLMHNIGGAWFTADPTRDLTMRILFAEFTSPRVEVQVQPWTLENGIANIDVLAEAYVPDGTQLVWEIQVGGVWKALDYYDENILNGLPALLPARIVFVGTTDLMPGVTFGAASTVTTWRPRSDFTHVSEVRTMPGDVDLVEVRLRLEGWDDARHDCECELLTGAEFNTVEEPEASEDRPTEDPGAIERRFFFELDPVIDAYKIKIEGTTDNVLITYHVAARIDLARATT